MVDVFTSILTLGLPTLLAIIFHEVAHGFVALYYGDDTAYRLGRLSLNPFRHIDLFGTLLLPSFLLITRVPFLFGYAKPVPIDFKKLQQARYAIVYVALAGPAMNFLLAFLSALLLHLYLWIPSTLKGGYEAFLLHSIAINITLAVFNLLPLPPLDGGRVAVHLLPARLAFSLTRLEPWGMPLLLLLMFGSSLILRLFDIQGNIISAFITPIIKFLMHGLLKATGL